MKLSHRFAALAFLLGAILPPAGAQEKKAPVDPLNLSSDPTPELCQECTRGAARDRLHPVIRA